MKVKGLLARIAEFCPTLLRTCAAASSAGGQGNKKRAVSSPCAPHPAPEPAPQPLRRVLQHLPAWILPFCVEAGAGGA